MVKAIIGKKIGMTQVFDEHGRRVTVTVIEAGPMVVVRNKTVEKDGYAAVQVGFGRAGKRTAKPVKGQFARAGLEPMRYLREVEPVGTEEIEVGTRIGVEIFQPGETVSVTGVSKGKGFAGAVKRWHFHGADMTHGSMIHRKPQSGGATDAARTFKGVKRPGHMGNQTVTQRGLKIERVDAERNLLLIRGAVPGANGGLLKIRKQEG